MHQFLVSTVAFIVLIGVMVIVHEFGHFFVAKLCGVRVEAFSLGFGPRLFGFTYGETEYKVCLLPLGGYVRMTGENLPGENMSMQGSGQGSGQGAEQGAEQGAGTEVVEAQKPDPGALTSHPRWQRMLIGVAGPISNFLLALVLMLIYYGLINEVPSVQVKTTTVEWVKPNSAASSAGFQPGDVVRSFDGVTDPTWFQIDEHMVLNANQYVAATVDRAGKTLSFSMHIPTSARNDDFDVSDTGLLPRYLPGPIQVAQVEPQTPAARAGLEPGDKIENVNGHAFDTVNAFAAYLQTTKSQPVHLVVERNGKTLQMAATPEYLDSRWMLGFSEVPIPFHDDPLSFGAAWSKSFVFCEQNSLLVVDVLERLVTHKVALSQMMGPVGIARAAGEAAEMRDWLPKFGLAAEISLNLGIFNLLPFPILDGGMIALLLIESVMRHDISINVKERVYQAAFVVLMVFFVFIIFSDVSKLPMFAHVRP